MQQSEQLRQLKNSARKARDTRKKADETWEQHKALIIQTYQRGDLSLQQIANETGVTKARVWQIVNAYVPPKNNG